MRFLPDLIEEHTDLVCFTAVAHIGTRYRNAIAEPARNNLSCALRLADFMLQGAKRSSLVNIP